MKDLIYPKSSGVMLPSAARTVETFSDVFTNNGGAKGLHIVIDVTVDAAAGSITPSIQAFDVASQSWYDLLVGAAITGVSTVVLRLHPSLSASANLIAKDGLPVMFRFKMAVADTDSMTYSVGFSALA